MNANQDTKSVVRYVVTVVNRDGMRTLAHPMQGRYTYAGLGEAQAMVAAMNLNNSREALEQVYGPYWRSLAVREVECWPFHFDPKTCWFD